MDHSLHIPVAPTSKKDKEPRADDAMLVTHLRDPYGMERAELEAICKVRNIFLQKQVFLNFARRYNVQSTHGHNEEIIRLCLRMIYDILPVCRSQFSKTNARLFSYCWNRDSTSLGGLLRGDKRRRPPGGA
jgi:hypothetical protein